VTPTRHVFLRWGSFGDDGYEELDAWVAYRLGLKTWANWVDSNVDPATTRVFFMSISTTHMRHTHHTFILILSNLLDD
jgi:hypothetical protein